MNALEPGTFFHDHVIGWVVGLVPWGLVMVIALYLLGLCERARKGAGG